MNRAPNRVRERLPRIERVARRREFLDAYTRGTKTHSRYSVMFLLPNSAGHPRLGITVTKKIGNAVARNRIKRRVREIYRRNMKDALTESTGVDLIINVKRAAADSEFCELQTDLTSTLRKALRRTRAGR